LSLLRILLFFLREAYVNLRRSWKVSLLAVFTITTSLFVGGLFLLLSENLARLLDDWRRQAKVIVYLRAPLPVAERADLVQQLEQAEWVDKVRQVSAERARQRFAEIFPSLSDLTLEWAEEPLPASLEVGLDPDRSMDDGLADWLAELRRHPAAELVDDDRDWLRQLQLLVAVFRGVGLILGGLLLAAATLTIASVIRLTAYLYRDEIAVLRLIGATEFYIRGPFYAEGLVQGATGAVVALAGLYASFRIIRPQSDAALLGTVLVGDFLPLSQLFFLLALGAVAGLLGAILSVRREAGVV
jgi:cell division transport system permease protein